MSETPAILLPYQQRWLSDTSGVKVMEKSRRTGISWTSAIEAVLVAGAEVDAEDVLYIGYNKEMAQEFIGDCADWVRAIQGLALQVLEELIKDEDKDIQAYRIIFPTGKKILALSSRPTALRGRQGYVIFDEAAFHNDLTGLLKAAKALRMWGSRLAIISTHDGQDNPFYELVADTKAGKWPYSLHQVPFDLAVKEGLVKRIFLRGKKKWSQEAEDEWVRVLLAEYGDDADEELFCRARTASSSYFSRALLESRSGNTPVMRLTCPDDLAQRPQAEREKFIDNWLKDVVPTVVELCGEGRQFYGMDFARSVDLSSIWIQEREGSKARVIAVLELGKTPHASQEQILFRVMDAIPRFAGGAHDARGNGSALAEVAAQRYGWGRITQVKATSNWYLEHFPRLKAALEDGSLYDVPRDDEIINDFRTVRVVAGIPRVTEKRTRGKGGQKRHGDTAIAACLAWSAMGSDIGPIEYRSAGNRGRPQQWDAEGPELDYEAGILRSELNLEGW